MIRRKRHLTKESEGNYLTFDLCYPIAHIGRGITDFNAAMGTLDNRITISGLVCQKFSRPHTGMIFEMLHAY